MPSALLTLVVKSVMPDREIFFREVASQSWFMGALVLWLQKAHRHFPDKKQCAVQTT